MQQVLKVLHLLKPSFDCSYAADLDISTIRGTTIQTWIPMTVVPHYTLCVFISGTED